MYLFKICFFVLFSCVAISYCSKPIKPFSAAELAEALGKKYEGGPYIIQEERNTANRFVVIHVRNEEGKWVPGIVSCDCQPEDCDYPEYPDCEECEHFAWKLAQIITPII